MCGIAGILYPEPEAQLSERLKAMLPVQAHRGPDDTGIWAGDGVALGMNRLAIIDIAGGRQPMTNVDESVVVVCNGEIYNFLNLRKELISRGHRFLSDHSDTEVI